jgi:glycosyltransferase involved in cell wall biosynthesis
VRTHDRPVPLREAIDSALAQSFDDFELIVSDDTGSAEPVVRSFRDHRVRYERAPDQGGPAITLRSGFRASRGSFLAILDDDDLWHPDFLSTAVSRLRADEAVGVVFTGVVQVVGGRKMRPRQLIPAGKHANFLPIAVRMPPAPSASVIRREVWDESELTYPLAETGLGATTLWLGAAASGWTFEHVAEPLVYYRRHNGQISGRWRSLEREIAVLERFRFDDPISERLRRDRLIAVRLRLAGIELRRRRWQGALAGLRRARADHGRQLRPRDWVVFSGIAEWGVRLCMRLPVLFAALRPLWHMTGSRLVMVRSPQR